MKESNLSQLVVKESDLSQLVVEGSEETEPQMSHRSSCEPVLSQLAVKTLILTDLMNRVEKTDKFGVCSGQILYKCSSFSAQSHYVTLYARDCAHF